MGYVGRRSPQDFGAGQKKNGSDPHFDVSGTDCFMDFINSMKFYLWF